MSQLINIGSLCIDYVYSVTEIAKVGETVACQSMSVFPGGKGLNQSIAAAKAGIKVVHFGAVGTDGFELVEFMQAAGVGVSNIVSLPGRTGHAVIQINSRGENSIVIAGGTNRELPQKMISNAVALAKKGGGWILMQNETNDVGEIIRLASAAGCKVALNLAPADAHAQSYNYGLLDLLIVNELEAMAVSGRTSVGEAFAHLITNYPDMNLVLTQGKDGLRYYQAQGCISGELGAFEVNVVDETAAGDTFVGYLLAGLVRGDSLHDILMEASAAGALATTRPGAAPAIPELGEVRRLMKAQLNSP